MRRLKYWLPVVIWMIVIFTGSTSVGSTQHSSRIVRPFIYWLFPHISDSAFETIHHYTRKAGHLTEYAILGILLWCAIHKETKIVVKYGVKGRVALVLLIAALYASGDEFHQSFIPSREPRVMDVVIDTCGAAIGVAVCLAARRIFARRQEINGCQIGCGGRI